MTDKECTTCQGNSPDPTSPDHDPCDQVCPSCGGQPRMTLAVRVPYEIEDGYSDGEQPG